MLPVEELAARAWPAAETLRVHGWLLRHTPSLARRRSNSALPVGDGADPQVVEDFYASRAARARVQVSPAEAHTGLDGELARLGWAREGETDVLGAVLRRVLAGTTPGAVAVAVAPRPDPGWIAAWMACDPRPDAEAHARDLFARIEPEAAFAMAADGLGVGVAVCERGWVGLFSVATAAGARRRGVAGAVVHALARWAADRGAENAYLQVEADNPGAHAFWARAGFVRSHGYHYRVAPA
jgi:GNAT superfamily N-acetyltransferase